MSVNVDGARVSPRIVYVGAFRFPDGDAAAVRVTGIGMALREAGFDVLFAGVEKRGRPEDRQDDGRFLYRGFRYLPEEDRRGLPLYRLKRAWLTHMSGSTTIRRLRSMDLTATRAIIVYNAFSPFLWRLDAFCRRRGIALVADCTEWYDPWHTMYGLLAWDTELRMRWLQPRIGNVIAISSFLERYYRQRGCSVVRVPPLVDMNERMMNRAHEAAREDRAIRLVYAGVPGRKDLLGNAIRALWELRKRDLPVVLDVVGPSREAVAVCMGPDAGLLGDLGDSVVYCGRVAHATALELIARADFSILLRPQKRYAQAGFPSKLVESLSLGVPMITNPTSDIAEYVRDGKEGILLEDGSPGAFAAGVRRILDMPRDRWRAMRDGARQRARECFDYRQYVRTLGQFMEEVIESGAGRRQEPGTG